MAISDWSTTASSNGNSDSNINWAEGQAPSTVNDSARSMMSRLKHWWNQLGANTTQGGTSNAYTITSGESLSAYANGMRFLWQPNADPTGNVTLNVDAIGAKKVYLPDGTQAGSGDLDADSMYDVVYDTALDSASGGFKIVGFPDASVSGSVYKPGGTDVALADGGTGASLADPNADRILFWDDSAGAMTWLAPSTGLTISGTNLTVDSTVWTSANDGAGSGLDADTLDGVQGSSYVTLTGSQTLTDKTLTSPTINGGSIQSAIQESSETSGTLTAASANKSIELTGNITIDGSVFGSGDMIIVYAGSSARTITQGSGILLRLSGGTTTGTRTLAAHGVAVLWNIASSQCIVAGDVT